VAMWHYNFVVPMLMSKNKMPAGKRLNSPRGCYVATGESAWSSNNYSSRRLLELPNLYHLRIVEISRECEPIRVVSDHGYLCNTSTDIAVFTESWSASNRVGVE
jgi:hypothetical protein